MENLNGLFDQPNISILSWNALFQKTFPIYSPQPLLWFTVFNCHSEQCFSQHLSPNHHKLVTQEALLYAFAQLLYKRLGSTFLKDELLLAIHFSN